MTTKINLSTREVVVDDNDSQKHSCGCPTVSEVVWTLGSTTGIGVVGGRSQKRSVVESFAIKL